MSELLKRIEKLEGELAQLKQQQEEEIQKDTDNLHEMYADRCFILWEAEDDHYYGHTWVHFQGGITQQKSSTAWLRISTRKIHVTSSHISLKASVNETVTSQTRHRIIKEVSLEKFQQKWSEVERILKELNEEKNN